MPTVHNSKLNLSSSGSVEITPTRRKPFEGTGTVCDTSEYASRKLGTRKLLGWREVVEVYDEKEKVTENIRGVVKHFELSDYK
ncbi:hypothetical protein GYMLUDRAFT_461649 [Collybiopsis luxurians FD-317 M1]|uniref:Uncharacterized protein n=1 Tax=Collybiopsis luxurians FD-317 M1 TaxID=944289 RepID=A0A0D0AJJ9_9AGAR|nr:hypothetical protein GYMLUDRAFT_461649 [Collybiopsis luxurians FD-317 M1]